MWYMLIQVNTDVLYLYKPLITNIIKLTFYIKNKNKRYVPSFYIMTMLMFIEYYKKINKMVIFRVPKYYSIPSKIEIQMPIKIMRPYIFNISKFQ